MILTLFCGAATALPGVELRWQAKQRIVIHTGQPALRDLERLGGVRAKELQHRIIR